MQVAIRLLDPAASPPRFAKAGDAGADLCAIEAVTLAPGQRQLVRTGLALAIPDGYVGLIHPRSGMAAKHGISMVNAPGTIDSGYRGEILVNLINLDTEHDFAISPRDRIAQLVIQQVERPDFVAVDELAESERGSTGHGSSGGFAGQ